MEEKNDLRIQDGFPGEELAVISVESFRDYIRNPIVQRLYVTDIGYFPNAEHHYMHRESGVPQYIYFYCTDGSGAIKIGNTQYSLSRNQAFTIPAGESHAYWANEKDPWSILWMHFSGSDTGLYPLEEKQVITFDTAYASTRMMEYFSNLLRVIRGHFTLGNFIYITNTISVILSETYFREKKDNANPSDRTLTEIIRYMVKNIGRNLTLDELCGEFSYSKSHINNLFHRYTQQPPLGFFQSLKMKQACIMLRHSNKMVYEIAQELGYSDPFYFSRAFQRTIGVSPREYRKLP